MIWRKLEPDEEIKHGDWLSYDGYDLNSTEAERIAWTKGHSSPELYAACGLIGQTVGILKIWRIVASEEPTSEPIIRERKIDLDL